MIVRFLTRQNRFDVPIQLRRSPVLLALAILCAINCLTHGDAQATTIGNGSTVQVTSNSHFPAGTVTFNTHNAGFTTVESVGGDWNVSNAIEMGGTTFGGQRFNYIGSNNLIFSNTTTLLIDNGIGVLNDGILDLSGGVHGNFIFQKYGSGTLAISGASTGSPDLRVNGGVLRANDGVGLPASRNLHMTGGILETSGTFNRTRGTGAGQIDWSGTGGFSALGAALTVDINGGGATNLGWNTSTGGRVVVLGPNFNQGGELRFNSTDSTHVVTLVDNLSLGGHHGLDSGPRVINVADNLATQNDWAVISGVIDSGTGGTINDLQKIGAGRLDLDGNNTYTGTTLVTEGLLNINGTTSGQGNYTVASGAVLGGTGTVGLAGGNSVTIQSGGTISAGASSGTLTIAGDLVLDAGAMIDWEYDGSGEDLVSVTGMLTLPLTATINAIDLGGSFSELPVVLTAGALAGATDLSGWTVTGLSDFTVAINGNDVVLVAPVPEPSSLLLTLIGLVGLTRFRRRIR